MRRKRMALGGPGSYSWDGVNLGESLADKKSPGTFPKRTVGLVVFILVLAGLTVREMVSEPAPETSDDGGLVVGTLFPITGDLSSFGPTLTAAARIAVEDLNAAGGVLGAEVTLWEADSGDLSQDVANPEVDRLLALGVDAIVGAASSAVSKLVIDKITGAGVIQFAPSNTSPDFTTYSDNGLYFRTAPPDLLLSEMTAQLMASEGVETVGVIYRQESYGTGLAVAFRDSFEELGGVIDPFVAYAPGTDSFDAEVDLLVAADPDAVFVIGFEEAASLVTTMHERGIGPTSDTLVHGTAGHISSIGVSVSDPSILTGMRGAENSVDLRTIRPFTDRLETAYEGGVHGVYGYGAETYDAIIIIALAAEVAGSTEPTVFAREINDVTRTGTKCRSFVQCRDLIAAGEDPDYVGIGGDYEFVDVGEPSMANYRILTYSGDSRPDQTLDEYITYGG